MVANNTFFQELICHPGVGTPPVCLPNLALHCPSAGSKPLEKPNDPRGQGTSPTPPCLSRAEELGSATAACREASIFKRDAIQDAGACPGPALRPRPNPRFRVSDYRRHTGGPGRAPTGSRRRAVRRVDVRPTFFASKPRRQKLIHRTESMARSPLEHMR